jgi:hypothetical protein
MFIFIVLEKRGVKKWVGSGKGGKGILQKNILEGGSKK